MPNMKISLNVALFQGGLLCSFSGLAQPRADESPGVGTTIIRRTFREVDRPLANPGQGWMSQARNPKTDPRFPCSVVYIRFNWADIEPWTRAAGQLSIPCQASPLPPATSQPAAPSEIVLSASELFALEGVKAPGDPHLLEAALWEKFAFLPQPLTVARDLRRILDGLTGAHLLFQDKLFGGATAYSAPDALKDGREIARRLVRHFEDRWPGLGPGEHCDLVDEFAS